MKTCPRCKNSFSLSNFYKNKRTVSGLSCYCKGCNGEMNKKYSPRYKGKQKEYQKKFYILNKDKMNKESNDRWRRERMECLVYYSKSTIPFCYCCEEDKYEFLAIDHINGGGNKHVKSIGGKLVRWLIKNKFPEGFRVLCHNCNMALGHHGYCPHEQK